MGAVLEVKIAGRRLPAGRAVVGVFAGDRTPWRQVPEQLGAALRAAVGRSGWKGAEGQVAEVVAQGGRIVEVRGLGTSTSFDARKLRGFVERAVESGRSAGDRRVVVLVPQHAVSNGPEAAARVVREAALAGHRYDRFLAHQERTRLTEVVVAPPGGEERAYRSGLRIGAALAAGVAWARDLADTPPNVATPAWMAAQAQRWARARRARIQILGPVQLRRRGMGGILAVGGGSSHPPRLVRIEIGRGARTIALVGKGVTFDTGGISIKPAAQMDEMKWDKSGACAVLGILEAAARLDLPVKLRAYLPLAENMPDGSAYRPGDIVRCANGKTVEITNTDAEGRMLLADALSWAASEAPDGMIEFSTLTGACAVALGRTGAGLFTPDDELAAALLGVADVAGERLWRLPLWSEFHEEMKGSHADLRNSGGRWGGASTAAAFLSQFTAPVERWAHIDIAGPAYVGEDKGRRGATGFGVALTVGWLRSLTAGKRR